MRAGDLLYCVHVVGVGDVGPAVNGRQLSRRQLSRLSCSTAARTARQKCVWYECDDHVVKTLTEEKFLSRLRNSRKFTPYLLFYTRCYQ